MKKVIYSIVSALILSVIFALIFPTWFLNEGARWTYLNDSARMDIFISGNVKNGRVQVGGGGMRITQPKWLSGSNFQGTMVELPASYRKSSYQTRLMPLADTASQDATLVIKFLGNIVQNRGQRMPARVTFRNLTLNGELIAAEKTVWHDQPFRLQRPFHPSESITLAFDVYKPLGASDFSYVNFLVAFLMLCIFSMAALRFKTAASHVLDIFCNKDIVQVLSTSYRNIDPVYRHSFWIIFGVLCFAFGFHTICFMWGNHDWFLLLQKHPWLTLVGNGRYMAFSVKVLLANGIYLPLIHDLVTFITLALNAVLLCRYWRLEKRVIYYVLCGLVLTAQPFTLGMLYFVNMTPEVFIGVTYVLFALLLSEKVITGGGYTLRCLMYSVLSVVLINFAMAMYPVLINTIAVAFIGRLLIQSFDWDGTWQQMKTSLKSGMIVVLTIILGILSYKLILTFFFPPVRDYNTEILSLARVPERLGILFKQCFHQLYEYNFPFIIQWVLWIFLGFTILLTLYICFTGGFKQKIVRIILLFGSLFGTQTAMIIAKTYVIADRVELFGLVFFEVLVMVLVFTRLRKLRNISVVLGTCIVFASVINDLDCLRVWKLGFEAEKMLWNRVMARLENQREFDPSRKYDVVQVGRSISIRPRFYTERREKIIGDAKPILYFSYDTDWIPFSAHSFYYPSHFLRNGFAYYRDKLGYEAKLKRLYQAGVLQKAEVWPKPNGLIVWKDMILFVTDGKELDNYRKKFGRELGKK